MEKTERVTIIVLAIFIVGITMGAVACQPVEAKKFKDQGDTWQIKDFDWKQMKKTAKSEYKNAVNQGRAIPVGYSYSKNVTVIKDGQKYLGTAFAIKNEKSIRCEVRGVGEDCVKLTDY